MARAWPYWSTMPSHQCNCWVQKVERETGVAVSGTKHRVEIVYRLAKPV
jgi:hypothetical protein